MRLNSFIAKGGVFAQSANRLSPNDSLTPSTCSATFNLVMVTAQYAETHLSQLLSAADNGEVVEIARPDKPTIHLVMASDPKESKPRPIGRRLLFGAGEGKIALPTDEEDRAMDKEIEDLMLNGPIFPPENA